MAQKKVNTHGRIIKNLRKTAAETKYVNPNNTFMFHLELFYDTEEGELITTAHSGSVGQQWTVFKNNPEIKQIGYITHPMTQQQLADMINKALKEEEGWE